MYVLASKAIIDPDNGFSPSRRHAIIWTYVRILLIGPYDTNLSQILIEILIEICIF